MVEDSPYTRWIGSMLGRYRLENLLAGTELGPLFDARDDASNASYLVRLLAVPPAQSSDALDAYETQLQRFVSQVGALRHPYILPLADFGLQQGVPYLVWPQLHSRSLTQRLAQSGPMDIVAAGRYLDQIAAALEAAHQQSTLHRNLSTDNIFIQLDGHLVVADFGVRRLTELLGGAERRVHYYGSLEACAPEQITGGPTGTATDVYALGAVTYRLLTAQPLFAADSVDTLLHQHLSSPPPSLGVWRRGLPPELDDVLAAALAKDSTQRFRYPGTFANAYHQVVAPNSMTRVPFVPSERLDVPGLPVSILAPAGTGAPASHGSPLPESLPRYASAISDPLRNAPSSGPTGQLVAQGRPVASFARGRRGARRLLGDGIFVVLVLVLLLAGSGLFVVLHNQSSGGAAPGLNGTVEFLDSAQGQPGHTDSLRITLHGLAAPPSGSQYDAWLIDEANEQVIQIGTLIGQGQTYTLADPGDGTNLLARGDKVEITVEQGTVRVPIGKVVLAGGLPPQALVHIRHLLVSYPTTPGKIGLLVGTLSQTQLLAAQATALQNAAAAGNQAAVQCGAQSILDIIEGTHGTHYHALDPSCASLNITLTGDGFGLLPPPATASGQTGGDTPVGYLADASDHASLAATAPDATADIRLHAGHVEVAIANIKGWVTAADGDALRLLTNPADASALADLVVVTDHAYHGVPAPSDRTINPVPGQAGAITAYEHGQFMATMSLAPSS
jgi:serine/threonine-protein kinase